MTTKKEEKPGAPSAGAAPTTQTPGTELKKAEATQSERFTAMVMREFSGATGAIELSGYQRRLIQNYFISTDLALKMAEEKRMKKSENNRDAVSVTWENVNMPQLAINVVACSRIGYDPALPNHINMVPYKNNRTGKYDIGFIEGYRGKELKARKYGYQVPDNVIVEVVYSKDNFKPLKKDARREVESFEFNIAENPFERGEITGGFYYHEFYEEPRRNKLMFYSLAEIEKRKPEYASVEFWGGKKDKWENGKKVGKEEVEGWHPEMVWKTLYRLAYNSITIDSQKIDDSLMAMLDSERQLEAHKEDAGDTVHTNIHTTIEQKTGSKTLNTNEAETPSSQQQSQKNQVATDVQYEEVRGGSGPGNGNGQPSDTLFQAEATTAKPGF